MIGTSAAQPHQKTTPLGESSIRVSLSGSSRLGEVAALRSHRVAWLLAGAVGLLVGFGAGPASGAVAKLITGRDIKNGSIALVDLSPSARAALRGGIGPAGPGGSCWSCGAWGARPVGSIRRKSFMWRGRVRAPRRGTSGRRLQRARRGRVWSAAASTSKRDHERFRGAGVTCTDAAGWYVTMGTRFPAALWTSTRRRSVCCHRARSAAWATLARGPRKG